MAATPAESVSSTRAKPRLALLVVDDEALVCTVLRRMFGRDHDVTVESSAEAALQRFQQGGRFDLILCDMNMPGMGGIGLHAQLCALAPEQASRMVFMTGGSYQPELSEFLMSVPNAHVEKPFDRSRLLAIVEQERK